LSAIYFNLRINKFYQACTKPPTFSCHRRWPEGSTEFHPDVYYRTYSRRSNHYTF